MTHFNRLGGSMDEANAECAAMDEDAADAKYEAHMTALVEAVKNHAKANYNSGGWDMVVECYEDSEIRSAVAGCATAESAIALLGEVAAVYHDRRLDAWHAGGLDDNGREPEEKTDVSHSHCTCADYDDCCDFCHYSAFMSELAETGPVCADGGYRLTTQCVDETWWGGRPQTCYMSQSAVPTVDEIPF